jgi:hypothetical protein
MIVNHNFEVDQTRHFKYSEYSLMILHLHTYFIIIQNCADCDALLTNFEVDQNSHFKFS